jgi:hypothetical protein
MAREHLGAVELRAGIMHAPAFVANDKVSIQSIENLRWLFVVVISTVPHQAATRVVLIIKVPQEGEIEMRFRSTCWCISFLGLILAFPVFGQTNTVPQGQAAAASPQASQSQARAVPQSSTTQPPNTTTQVASTMEGLREQMMLDRIEQLEKRIAELEARGSSPAPGTAPTAVAAVISPQQTPAPAAATPATAAAATPAPEAAPPNWSIGPIDFSGSVDAYYGYNANHPESQTTQLYNFDTKANQFSLNMAEIKLSHTADPVGFELDLGYGRAFQIIHAGEPGDAPNIMQNIEQAYVSFKPAKLKGLEIDFGEFVTSAGAEVIETQGNWNYSRSLLFAWAIPYYHFGLRTTLPIGKHFTGGVQVVNGWNNIEDNNGAKTLGFTTALTYSKFSWFTNIYTGPENPHTNVGWRNLFDTTVTFTPNSKITAYVNFDYGQNNSGSGEDKFTAKWYGLAGALKYQFNSKWSLTPRIEFFSDPQGFSTGTSQTVKEFTLTGEYRMLEGLLARLEYRHDWSNQFFFDRGNDPASHKEMDTVAFGVVGYFGPKR